MNLNHFMKLRTIIWSTSSKSRFVDTKLERGFNAVHHVKYYKRFCFVIVEKFRTIRMAVSYDKVTSTMKGPVVPLHS